MLLFNPKNGFLSLLTEFDATSIRGKGRVLSCILLFLGILLFIGKSCNFFSYFVLFSASAIRELLVIPQIKIINKNLINFFILSFI